jgi:hypothetical protein
MISTKQALRVCALGVVLLSAVGTAFAHPFSNSSLSGPYVFALEPFGVNAGAIGILTFSDGAVTASNLLLGHYGAGVFTDTANGTYSVNSNGTGEIDLTRADNPLPNGGFDSCPALSPLDFTLADRFGVSADFTDTYGGGNTAGVCGGPDPFYGKLFKLVRFGKYSNASLSGNYLLDYVAGAPGLGIIGTGLVTFDGAGKITGGSLALEAASSLSLSGTYAVNADGSATINVTVGFPTSGFGEFSRNESWKALLADGRGTRSVFLDTVNSGMGTTTIGTLQKQF